MKNDGFETQVVFKGINETAIREPLGIEASDLVTIHCICFPEY